MQQVIIVGSGQLARELVDSLDAGEGCAVVRWPVAPGTAPSIVVHAGSGRELAAVAAFCEASGSPLVELATGSVLERGSHGFPVVVCPNTNILMLKFMGMLERSGHLFHGHRIALTESHQAKKTSVPGTAVGMAHALGLAAGDIRSVRSAEVQSRDLHIPKEHLGRHAYHRIDIGDGLCSLTLETRVYGDAPYADGVARIVAAVRAHPLDNRIYSVMEFVHSGWL